MGRFRFATAVKSGPDPRILRSIAMEGVSLALWNRKVPDALENWLASLAIEELPQFEGRVASREVAERLRSVNPATSHHQGDALAQELARLAGIASDILASPLLDIRLGGESPDRGSEWRLDARAGRLRCTLLGAGVEYGPMASGFAPGPIHQMPCGAVGIFRGMFWPGPELPAILHRMPRQTGQGASLTLTISPV